MTILTCEERMRLFQAQLIYLTLLHELDCGPFCTTYMRGLKLPLWEARRSSSPTLGLDAFPSRFRPGILAFRCSNMTSSRAKSDQIGDCIKLRRECSPASKGLIVGPHDIQRVSISVFMPLGLGTANKALGTSIDHRALNDILDTAFSMGAKSAQDFVHTLRDSILATSHNIRGCNIRAFLLPQTGFSSLRNTCDIQVHENPLGVAQWDGMVAETGKIPGPVTHLNETKWRMRPDKGRRSNIFRKNGYIQLQVSVFRDCQDPPMCSTPKSDGPELKAPSRQALGVTAVPDHGTLDYGLHEHLAIQAQTDSFPTAEALGSYLADEAYTIADARCPNNGITRVAITISRPAAGGNVGMEAVVIARERWELSCPPSEQLATLGVQGKHRAFVALGANIGDRISNIEEACRMMDSRGIRILQTSALYETEAMYVVDQDPFINGACEVSSFLPIDTITMISNLCLCWRRLRHESTKTS